VDMLKLKVSYGVQGNDGLGSYPYSDQYTHSYNEETGDYSIALSYKGNENLTWETSKSFNVGVDFELLNRYLNGTVEFFNRDTEDLLYNKPVPYSSGNPTGYMPVNVGSIRNRGFELSFDGSIVRTKNVQWNWNANFSHYTNTILSLDESKMEEGIKGTGYIYRVGGSLYNAYMYRYAGVNPENGLAQYYKKVLDDEGEWTGEDEVVDSFTELTTTDRYDLGSVLPKLYGGFGTSLNAFGFDFSIQLSYQLGGRYYDGSYQQLMWTQDQKGSAWHKDVLNAWTPDNTNTDVPRNDGNIDVSQNVLDRFLTSSNYLSINNATLGYTLPSTWTKKIGISALRVYVAGDNLFVLSARKGMDPRYSMGIGSMTSGAGINTSSYAAMRAVTGGISLTF